MKRILLVGTGNMAREYYRVLRDFDVALTIVGRSGPNADAFHKEFGVNPVIGGIKDYLINCQEKFDGAIVAVGVDLLNETAACILRFGCKRILLEKPGGLNFDEIRSLASLSLTKNAEIFIAYNRRFYTSVSQLLHLAEDDGGILSGSFEFTEWSHVIKDLNVSETIKENYFLANSTHVLDLAFYIMGKPKDLSSVVAGDCGWHKPSVFAGSGRTERNILFSYSANWESAGRWGVEVQTAKRKLILRPMEKLFQQRVGELTQMEVDVKDSYIDEKYKPGVYRQVQAFLSEEFVSSLKTLHEHVLDIQWMHNVLNGTN
jgi:predicted dehydrogenase